MSNKCEKFPERGIATKSNPNPFHGNVIQNLDEIPFPVRDILPMEKYVDLFAYGKSIQVITSRGCPHRCHFCNEAVLPGKPSYRARSAKNIVDEIELIIKLYGPDEIYFDDSSFTYQRKHILSVCNELKKRDVKIAWSCMADALVDEDVLSEMAQSGCRAIKFGVESADHDVLKRIPKHVNLDDIKKVVKACKKVGIKTHGTFMFGLPGENKQKAKKTIDFAMRLGTDTAQFSVATPYPGTRFFEMAQKNNWLIYDDWEKFGNDVVVKYPDYSEKDIYEMWQLALSRWQRTVAFKKPKVVVQYLQTAYKMNGMAGVMNKILEGSKILIRGAKWR